MTNKDEDKIELYLSGLMNQDDRENFEDELKDNPELMTTFDELKLAYELINHAGRIELMNKFDAFDAEEKHTQDDVLKPVETRSLWIRRLSQIAAVLVVGFAMYFFIIKDSSVNNHELFASYIEAYPDPVNVRDNSEGLHSDWTSGVDAYIENDFAQAIIFFNKSQNEVPEYLTEFYLAQCYIQKTPADYNKSIDSFELVLKSQNDYNIQSNWYLALLYLENDNIERAIHHLTNVKESGSYKSKESDEILDILSSSK